VFKNGVDQNLPVGWPLLFVLNEVTLADAGQYTFVASNVPVAEGATTLVAEATDAAGNAAQAQRTVELDTLPPSVAITDPAAGTVTPAATLAVSVSVTDPHLDRVEVNGVSAQLSGGSWVADVPLAEGATDLVATAWDELGWNTSATVAVVRDSTAPAVSITAPAEGSHLAVETVEVSGTVADEAGVTVSVNGAEATLGTAGGGSIPWSLSGVALAEGENRLIARVTDSLGNQGAHTRVVYRDTVAPELVSAEPADGALAVPPSAAFTATFSEDLDGGAAAAGWSLELADGTALAATASLAGAALTVVPDQPLPSLADVRLLLTAGLTDLAGNALAAPATLAFTVADVEAPPAPVLTAAVPAYLCASRLDLAGTAEAEGLVRVTGGAAGGEARAAADGTFSLSVDLRPGALNHLEITVRDRDGNLSAATVAEVVQDCQGPTVVSVERSGDDFTVSFDEVVDAATLGSGITLADATGPLPGTVTSDASGTTATFTPDAAPPAEALRLEVGTAVRDLAGNPLAFPWSEVFGADVASTFLAGRVLDAATGRPLAGAEVVVQSTDGVLSAEPVPGQTTPDDGRFRVPVPTGTHYLVASRPGYTPVLRLVSTSGGQGSDVFDPRLTPAAEPITVGPAGGSFGDPARRDLSPVLEVPANALASDTPVAVTALGEQALPALLPYGWSPRGAAWLDLAGATLAAPANHSFPVDAADGTSLVLISLDPATLQWDVEAEVVVFDGAVSHAVSGQRAWAAVEADLGPPAPPAPTVGIVLGSAPAPLGDEVTAAAISFDPAQVLPSQASRATVAYTLGADAASGLAVTVTVHEELTLLDGTVRREAPYDTDLVVYRAGDGSPRSRFPLRPSLQAVRLPLQMGAEDVSVHAYGGATVRGNVLGPLGGTVTDAEGDRVDLPAGAVPEPTAVLLARLAQGDLPVAVPAGFDFLGYLDLDLSGRDLDVPAALTLELGAAPAAGEEGLLFQVVEVASAQWLRPVARIVPTASGWTTEAIDPVDLPWAGVRRSAGYLFARRTADLAYLRGDVRDLGGSPAPGLPITAAVDGTPLGWLQVSNEAGATAGSYVLPAPLGGVTATAQDPSSGDAGSGAATLATIDERIDLDLLLQVTGPQLVEVVPADGATGVTPGIEPTLRFTEVVDPATLAAGVQLYNGASPVAISVAADGSLVRVTPLATLSPETTYELRVTTALRDLQGHRVDTASSTTFTTLEEVSNDVVDPTQVFVYEPDAAGDAIVQGLAGAVPGGSLVFVENTTSFVSTPSVTAASDGSFTLTIQATLDDVLLLHVVVEGANEHVWTLPPFLSADGRGGHVGAQGGEFTTVDGVVVAVEEGTFDRATVVRVDPATTVSPAPIPADFEVLSAFDLDFGGAVAQRGLDISVPAPAGFTGEEAMLARVWRIFGSDYWMLHDLLRLQDGRLTSDPPPEAEQQAVSMVGAASMGSRDGSGDGSGNGFGVIADGAVAQVTEGSQTRYDMVPGAANPGRYMVMHTSSALDFVGLPIQASTHAYFQNLAVDGLVAVVNDHISNLLDHDAILMPTRQGQTYTLEARDLTTNLRFFEGTFAAPSPGSLPILPETMYDDGQPPIVLAGSPLRVFQLTASQSYSRELDAGVTATWDIVSGGTSTLNLEGDAGAVHGGAEVVLVGLDDDVDTGVPALAGGDFQLSTPVTPGNRYLLILSATIAPTDDLVLSFSKGLASPVVGVEVTDSAGRDVAPELAPAGSRSLVISPDPAWLAGETYTLKLLPELADGSGNQWGETVEVPFQVAGSRQLDTFALDAVRDVERLGSWLFVAADTDGFLVLDGSDPSNLENLVAGDVRFQFPLADPVTALAVDPHGRVLVAGGGIKTFGQLKIFDPLAFDPDAVAAAPADPAVRYGAFRGSTIVSDWPEGSSSLPAGRPRHVSVLSEDDEVRWRVGSDPLPAGVSMDPVAGPAGGDGLVTLSGSDGTPGHPVTVRNLSAGRWQRVDADGAGAWSVQLQVRTGDRLQVLKNRQTLAYVATLGVGIQVVDVDAFYGEAPEDWNAPAVVSDVIGTYSGFGDPDLSLCNEDISDIGSALVDLGTLYGDPAHPLTVVGLVTFRGLALFESDPNDVGSVSFYNDACARIDGYAGVFGLDIAEDYPIDLDGDGAYTADELHDYVVVAHRQKGVLVYDATDRDSLTLVGLVPVPGQAERVSVDRDGRRIFVSAAGGGIYVVDFHTLPGVAPRDGNQDLVDDRVMEIIALDGITNSKTFLFPELGLAYAGGLERGVTSLAVGEPKLSVVVDGSVESGDSAALARYRPVSALAPLGVPTVADPSPTGAWERRADFRLLASLPGVSGDTVSLDVVSLGAGGGPISPAGVDTDLPAPALDGLDGVVLHRLATEPWQDGYQLFLSDELVAVAELRATGDYQRSALEEEGCRRCDGSALGIDPAAREILSGDRLAVRFPDALRTELANIYDAARLDAAEVEVASVRWETSPSARQEPLLNPAVADGEAVPGTLLHSGEMTTSSTDLRVPGRGLVFALRRHYRSQTVGAGPLGPGWDHAYNQRLRELPDGDVEVYDGRGRRDTFTLRDDGAYDAPEGHFVDLSRTGGGWLLIRRNGSKATFDVHGRLVTLADAARDSAETGNELRFLYDAASRLTQVTDSLGRSYALAYDTAGRLGSVTDFTGRQVTYGYDTDGRLATVTSPAITTGPVTFPQGLVTSYDYEAANGSLTQRLNQRDNLVSVTDAKQQIWLELTFSDADADGVADEVTGQTWGGDPLSLTYDFGTRETVVTDRRGYIHTSLLDEDGRVIRYTDPAAAVTTMTYDEEGLLASRTEPLGRLTELVYDTEGDRRSRGNLLSQTVTADSRGANGSPDSLVTSYLYDERTNRVRRATDPWGAVTEVDFTAGGLPTEVRRGVGTAYASTSSVSYNDYGQPVSTVDPDGRRTDYTYFDSGAAAGYLRTVVTDPLGLALTTRHEVDELGRPTAVIDPRGTRHENTYNELGWLVETVAAASPSSDGAPALNLRTTYVHDANGNVVEERQPVGQDGDQASTHSTYGMLDELLSVEHTTQPASQIVRRTFDYDEDRNLIREIDAVGTVTETDYDGRGLPVSVRRAVGLPSQANETFLYGAEGQLIQRLDPLSNSWTRSYDGYGRLSNSFDPLGNRTRTTYLDSQSDPDILYAAIEVQKEDAGGAVTSRSKSERDPLGRMASLTGFLWQGQDVASARELTTSYFYNGAGDLTSIVDPMGRSTSWSYDGAGRTKESTDPVGNRTQWLLDAAGNTVVTERHETLPDGGTAVIPTAHVYDAVGRPTVTADALGNETRAFYDAQGNPVVTMDAEGHLTSRQFDSLGRLLEEVKPTGIAVTYDYDPASRLTGYTDALGNATSYLYDPLGRQTAVTYPDATQRTSTYDAAGRRIGWVDPNGTEVSQTYDDLGRLTGRAVETPGAGVVGPTSESFSYDAMGRLTQATRDGLVSQRTYDSLSRLISEATDGKVVSYLQDDSGNVVEETLPSAFRVGRSYDPLNRLAGVQIDPSSVFSTSQASYGGVVYDATSPGTWETLASYVYQGRDRLAGKQVQGLTSTRTRDAAGRLVEEVFTAADGSVAHHERLSWSPRNLITAREGMNGMGQVFAYDGAAQLTATAAVQDAAAQYGNNSTADPAQISSALSAQTQTYDTARNLLSRTYATPGGRLEIETPTEPSGRNRPASVDGEALSYDANGNLVAHGDRSFEYDFQNRLTRVMDGGVEVASYSYDAFGRRVEKVVGGVTETTVWSGWQPAETYEGGQLTGRQIYGRGLDEIVEQHRDLDGDGTLDSQVVPLYDSSGNLTLTARPDGSVLERYSYTSFGDRQIRVDVTPPVIHQVRTVGPQIWIELTEEVSRERFADALASGEVVLEDLSEDPPLPVSLQLGSLTSAGSGTVAVSQVIAGEGTSGVLTMSATSTDAQSYRDLGRRRLILDLSVPPAAGTPLRLTVPGAALVDLFLNQPTADFSHDFSWPSVDTVVHDTAAPEIFAVNLRGGALELTFTEEPDLATATSAIDVGTPLTWALSADRLTLRSQETLAAGSYSLDVTTALTDLVAKPLTGAFQQSLTIESGQPDADFFLQPDDRLTATSTVDNAFGFHGLPKDTETGLVYVRNRHYDPQLGRFLQPDPLGYVDGPNPYQYSLNSPVNFSDPMGLEVGWQIGNEHQRLEDAGVDPYRHGRGNLDPEAVIMVELGGLAAFGGPVGWTAYGGLVAAQVEGRYAQMVELEERPDASTLGRAVGVGVTDMAFIGPAEELSTGQDRVTGEDLTAGQKIGRLLEVVPPAARLWHRARGFVRSMRGVPTKRVGRWMSREELAKMRETGRLQEGGGGQTRVLDPADPNTYRNAPAGDVYVEFDVSADRVLPHSQGTGRVPGPNSFDAKKPSSSKSDYEMPAVSNIEVVER